MTNSGTNQAEPPSDDAADEHGESGQGAAFPIVGVGASAGGLEAFTDLLKHLPIDTGMAFVLVQHLDPLHASALTQILSRISSMPVHEAANNLPVEANRVYVIPPNMSLGIVKGVLKLEQRPEIRTPHHSIDYFFKSLAQDQRGRAIAVLLSGTATDGTLGLEAIKAEGGITLAQDESARYDSMPRSAVAAGCVDLVLSPENIAKELARIAKHPFIAGQIPELAISEDDLAIAPALDDDNTPPPSSGRGAPPTGAKREPTEGVIKSAGHGFKKILLLLRNHCGIDFSLYKSTTIQRRITRRMVLSKQDSLDAYANFLRGNASEMDALYSDALISVTSFFRNPEAFDVLKQKVFPRLLQQRGEEPLRVWVIGCSTGQEAYSISMAFLETVEKSPRMRKLQVFATDLNDALLDKARHGLYPRSLAQDVSSERLRRFFVEEQGGYRINKALRELVVFAQHNLISDPPFSRMDLISCRNLLIYFGQSLQRKIFPIFHYAIKPEGFLLLGASESIGSFTDLFESEDKKYKIYSRKPAATSILRLPVKNVRGESSPLGKLRAFATPTLPGQGEEPEALHPTQNAQREADRVTINQFGPPGVLINSELQILQFRGTTKEYLQPPTGKASFDVLKMAREGLKLPLRAAINKAKKENKTAREESVSVHQNGGTRTVNIAVIPLKNLRDRYFLILFEDADKVARAGPRSLTPEAPGGVVSGKEAESRRITELEHEIAETRDYLQSLQDQHEAANEELQASNEEVQSSNEELQSINEELETSKEELESANEELTTFNEEMGNRNSELNRLNSDLVNLQSSTHLAILLLGRDLTIRRFSAKAEKLFNLQSSDIGRAITGVRHNLDLSNLAELIDEVISNVREFEREVRDKDGRWYSLRVHPYLTLDNKVDGAVLVLVDIDQLKRAEQAITESREHADAILRTVPDLLVVLTPDLHVLSANDAFYSTFKVSPLEAEACSLFELANVQWDVPKMRQLLEDIIPRNSFFSDLQVSLDLNWLGRRTMILNARVLNERGDKPKAILLGIRDITEILTYQADLRQSEARKQAILKSALDAIITIDHEGKCVEFNPAAEKLFGYTRADLIGKPLAEFIIPARLREKLYQGLAQYLATGEGQVLNRHIDMPALRADGTEFQSELAIVPVPGSQPPMFTAFLRDVTERKQAEQSLREAGERKNEFLATLAHELRNPLAPIRNMLEIMKRGSGSAELIQKAHNTMERQLGYMALLIEDLLDMSRISRGTLALRRNPVELASVLHQAVEASSPAIESLKHQLTVTLPPHPVYLDADPMRLAQVFLNLLNNAAKFTDPGGRISLGADEIESAVVISVKDTGIGIPPEMLPKIFEMFTQVDRSPERPQGGLGIGLTLVKRLVEMHGGSVHAFSEGPGHGSEFVVRLPTMSEKPRPQPPAAVSRTMPTTGRRILVVDDNQDSAESLAMLLKLADNQLHLASDGLQALQAAESFKPEVVLLDIGLPKLNGYAVCRKIREQPWGKEMVLIALTGWGQDEDRLKSKEAGFNGHLIKPVDYDSLLKLLAELLEK